MLDNATLVSLTAKELLQRVANSPQFQKSKRLREVLLYLGDRAIKDPDCVLREQEIGIDVLGRPPDYDTSHDTLVRVLVSHLRKKLQEYFAGEGKLEPIIIDIPKGTYLPVFRRRHEGNGHAFGTGDTSNGVATARRWWAWLAVALAVILAAALGWGFGYHASAKTARPARPMVQAFWLQLFGNGQQTNLVMSDVTLLDFEMLIGGPVSLSEYEAHEFDRMAETRIKDPIRRTIARDFINRVTTAMSDVHMARDFGVLASEMRMPLNLISARDMSSPLISSMNTILLGSWRANPWMGLFEDQTVFRGDYQESPPAFRFVNRSPLPGEQASYPAEWRNRGYCRVTFFPNPHHTGNVLLITGSDVISAEAGGRFIVSEADLGQLRQKLGAAAGKPMPHFEVLLRTDVVNSTVPRYELVAYRPH